MVLPRLNRLALLALLPVLATVLYLEGQRFDPALIRFSGAGGPTGVEATAFPESLNGYRRAAPPRIFVKENLYEYINGHAEYFLSAGFKRLAVGEYGRPGGDTIRPDILADIYDMGTDLQAFGVFTDEAGESAVEIPVGTAGARTAQGVSFVTGKYYVRVSTFQEIDDLEEVAKAIEERIGTTSGHADAFADFPDIGEVVSTRYVNEAYRGLDFAGNVIEREVRVGDETIQVARYTGDPAAVAARRAAYLEFFRENDTPFSRTEEEGRTLYRVDDPYEGNWLLIVEPGAVFGIYDLTDDATLGRVLAALKDAGRAEKE